MSATEHLPELRVELDGEGLDRAAAAHLTSVYVAQQLSVPALCELTFTMSPEHVPDVEDFRPGRALRVAVMSDELFAGEITGLAQRRGTAGDHMLCVRGYDLLHRLRKRRPLRAHVERTLAGLARDLVSDVGLHVELAEDGPVWRRLLQWRQSDLEMLTDAASRSGLYFGVRGRSLEFTTLEGRGEPLRLEAGRSLLEVNFDASAERACRAVNVRGWSTSEAERHAAGTAAARRGRHSAIDALGDLAERLDARELVDELTQSDTHAAELAQAELDWHAADEVQVHGIAAGDARLRPGARVALAGVSSAFDGDYVVTDVVHRLDRRHGFRSEFDTSPPSREERSRAATMTLGTVIAVDDPNALGRVRVSLPNLGDLETDWLAVAAPGAGPGKGISSLPDIGDRVLLLLPRDDAAQGVVVGGLYGGDGPPDAGVRNGRVHCYTLLLPGGQRLLLDGERRIARLENGGGNHLELAPGRARLASSGGSYVELTEKRVRIHANADLELEAPGRSVIVRGARVDFETG